MSRTFRLRRQKPKRGGQVRAHALVRLIAGYRISQCIYVAAELRVADLLADGPKSVDELSAATATHTASLYRVLRLLAGAGLLAEEAPRR